MSYLLKKNNNTHRVANIYVYALIQIFNDFFQVAGASSTQKAGIYFSLIRWKN